MARPTDPTSDHQNPHGRPEEPPGPPSLPEPAGDPGKPISSDNVGTDRNEVPGRPDH